MKSKEGNSKMVLISEEEASALFPEISKMETNIEYKVFEGEEFTADESLLSNLNDDFASVVRDMLATGHYRDGLDVSMFLREDLSIDLDKLALATQLSVKMLEAYTPEEDATLNVINLEGYFQKRGIQGNESQEKEEKTFLMRFITGEAMEESMNDTLIVKFI